MEGSNRNGSQADQSRGLPLRTISGVVDPHTIREDAGEHGDRHPPDSEVGKVVPDRSISG